MRHFPVIFLSSLLAIALLCFAFTPLVMGEDFRMIIFYSGCDDPEISIDIEHSFHAVRDFLNANNISSILSPAEGSCGYQLMGHGKSRRITSAMTDVDLVNEITIYFEF